MTFSSPKRLRLTAIAMLFLSGVVIGALASWPVTLPHFWVSLTGIGVALLLPESRLRLLSLLIVSLVVGMSWSALYRTRIVLSAPYEYEGRARVLSVRPSDPPSKRILWELREGEKQGLRFRTYVEDWGDDPGVEYYVTASIQPSKHVSDRGYAILGTAPKATLHEKAREPSLLFRFRRALDQAIGRALPEPYASLAVGLLTGVNDNFDTSFQADLRRTGTTHIVAVSGYNLTIVAILLRRLGQRWHRAVGLSLAAASILGYVVLAGASPSITRGAVVAGFSLLALSLGRRTHRLPLVLLAASCLTLLTPLGLLYNLSWQLSFLAFAGILFLSPLLTPSLEARMGTIGGMLGETLSAELMVLPLLLKQFGELSLISPLVNITVLSITPLAMAVSAAQAVLSLLSTSFGAWFAWLSYPILWLIVHPIQWSSRLPFAHTPIPPIPTWGVSLWYSALIAYLVWRHFKSKELQ